MPTYFHNTHFPLFFSDRLAFLDPYLKAKQAIQQKTMSTTFHEYRQKDLKGYFHILHEQKVNRVSDFSI